MTETEYGVKISVQHGACRPRRPMLLKFNAAR